MVGWHGLAARDQHYFGPGCFSPLVLVARIVVLLLANDLADILAYFVKGIEGLLAIKDYVEGLILRQGGLEVIGEWGCVGRVGLSEEPTAIQVAVMPRG